MIFVVINIINVNYFHEILASGVQKLEVVGKIPKDARER